VHGNWGYEPDSLMARGKANGEMRLVLTTRRLTIAELHA
jgi:hypothetical protein